MDLVVDELEGECGHEGQIILGPAGFRAAVGDLPVKKIVAHISQFF